MARLRCSFRAELGVPRNAWETATWCRYAAAFCRGRRPIRRGATAVSDSYAKAQKGWIFPCLLCWNSGRAVVGRLLRPPRKGSVVVIEFADGLHEYVTTPVKRVLQLCGQDTYYLQTANSSYRLEVRSNESGVVDQPVAN